MNALYPPRSATRCESYGVLGRGGVFFVSGHSRRPLGWVGPTPAPCTALRARNDSLGTAACFLLDAHVCRCERKYINPAMLCVQHKSAMCSGMSAQTLPSDGAKEGFEQGEGRLRRGFPS